MKATLFGFLNDFFASGLCHACEKRSTFTELFLSCQDEYSYTILLKILVGSICFMYAKAKCISFWGY